MALSLTQTATVRVVEGQGITNNLLRLLSLSPSVSISGSVATADIAAGAVTPAKTTPGAYFYGTSSGTNTYTVALNPPLGALANGAEVLVKMGISNTAAATASLNVDSLGAKNIYHRNGIAVKPGDLVADDIVRFRYNTSRNAAAGGWDVMEVLPSALIRPATNETAGTATVQTLVNTPPLTAYSAGVLLLVKVGTSLTNTGSLTLNCDGLGARNVLRTGAAALLAGDWVAGQTYLVYDDGTQFILLTKDRPVAIAADARNLVIYNANLTTVTVAADEVVLKTSNGLPMLAASVSLTVDFTAGVALNGLETGATRTTSTWYYLWLISDGTNVRGVLETAGTGDGALSTGPDLTNAAFAGYIYQGLVGRVRLNATGAGEIVPFYQSDRKVFSVEQVVLNAKAASVNDTWQVLAGADVTAFRAAVPPDAKLTSGFIGSDNASDDAAIMICGTTAAGALDVSWHLGAKLINLSLMSPVYSSVTDPGPTNAWGVSVPLDDIPVRGGTARNIQWKSRATTLTVSLSVTGYTF